VKPFQLIEDYSPLERVIEQTACSPEGYPSARVPRYLIEITANISSKAERLLPLLLSSSMK
jgi:hypothetical protein